MDRRRTLAFLHTSHIHVDTFTQLAAQWLPGIAILNLVDEALLKNTIRAGQLTPGIAEAVIQRIGSAHEQGADAVMVTCSSIGPAVSLARSRFNFPIIRIDEAMAAKAVTMGRRIGVLATVRTTLEPTRRLLFEKADEQARSIQVVDCLCSKAFDHLMAGDTSAHDRSLIEALTRLSECADVVVLAQASMARMAAEAGPLSVPVLASPQLAVEQALALWRENEPKNGEQKEQTVRKQRWSV